MDVKTCEELTTARHVGLLRTFRGSEAPNRLHQVQLCVASRKIKTRWLKPSLHNFFSSPIIGAFAIRAPRWFRLLPDSFLGYDAVAILVAL